MRFIADLHVHSHYSRATSPDMCPEGIGKWAQLKGITVIGTGDFTHPQWIKELKKKLEPGGNGLFTLKKRYTADDVPGSCKADVSFILSAEISSIYSKNGKTRKVHSVILSPDFESAEQLNLALSKIGNLKSDGRPILGLDAKKLL
jgi:DNA helicase-2/ATP-dependent DNA helicase PcrA